MSAALLVLSVAAFALLAWLASFALQLSLPAFDGLARTLAPEQRVRLWLGASWFPAVFGGATVLVALLPGWLGHDHCLVHEGHHLHLCPRHAEHMPGWALTSLVVAATLRVVWTVCSLGRRVLTAARVARTLGLAVERRGDLLVHADPGARAFVLGTLRSEVHVSQDLLAMDPDFVAAVIAHERAHVRGYDLAWRALCEALAFVHLPGTAGALGRRLAMAQEMRADEHAAGTVGDRTSVAEALLALARTPARGLMGASIAGGDVAPRVRSLLAPPIARRRGVLPALLGSAAAMLVSLAVEHHGVHHALETLLGSLAHL